MLRDPLPTINSRITKCELNAKSQISFVKSITGIYEEFAHNETCTSFAVKNWVRRNSFVERHASWRVHSESVFSDPLSLWELCMAAGFANRCPDLATIGAELKSVPSNLNSHYQGATLSKQQEILNRTTVHSSQQADHTWESLSSAVGQENYKYVQIAQSMAMRYGYNISQSTPVDFHCKFHGSRGGKNGTYWDCFINQ